MRTKSLLFIITLSVIVKLPAQFLDAVTPLKFDTPGELKKINSGNLLTGNSLQLSNDILIDGNKVSGILIENLESGIQNNHMIMIHTPPSLPIQSNVE